MQLEVDWNYSESLKDKRRCPRLMERDVVRLLFNTKNVKVHLNAGIIRVCGRLIDISANGMLIHLDSILEVGSIVDFCFYLDSRKIVGQAKVVRVSNTKRFSSIAIYITKLSDRDFDLLNSLYSSKVLIRLK